MSRPRRDPTRRAEVLSDVLSKTIYQCLGEPGLDPSLANATASNDVLAQLYFRRSIAQEARAELEAARDDAVEATARSPDWVVGWQRRAEAHGGLGEVGFEAQAWLEAVRCTDRVEPAQAQVEAQSAAASSRLSLSLQQIMAVMIFSAEEAHICEQVGTLLDAIEGYTDRNDRMLLEWAQFLEAQGKAGPGDSSVPRHELFERLRVSAENIAAVSKVGEWARYIGSCQQHDRAYRVI
jgi:hypothetical protein